MLLISDLSKKMLLFYQELFTYFLLILNKDNLLSGMTYIL